MGGRKWKEQRILRILYRKIDDFTLEPNRQQRLKLDVISEHMKPYFLDVDGLSVKGGFRYVVSFERIMLMFPCLKVIDFTNSYTLDDTALTKLIAYLRKTPETSLRTVKFLYYQYDHRSRSPRDDMVLNQGLV